MTTGMPLSVTREWAKEILVDAIIKEFQEHYTSLDYDATDSEYLEREVRRVLRFLGWKDWKTKTIKPLGGAQE